MKNPQIWKTYSIHCTASVRLIQASKHLLLPRVPWVFNPHIIATKRHTFFFAEFNLSYQSIFSDVTFDGFAVMFSSANKHIPSIRYLFPRNVCNARWLNLLCGAVSLLIDVACKLLNWKFYRCVVHFVILSIQTGSSLDEHETAIHFQELSLVNLKWLMLFLWCFPPWGVRA